MTPRRSAVKVRLPANETTQLKSSCSGGAYSEFFSSGGSLEVHTRLVCHLVRYRRCVICV
jgi:hypothetical protein